MSDLDNYFDENNNKLSNKIAIATETVDGNLKIRLSDLGYNVTDDIYIINPNRDLAKSYKNDPNIGAWGRTPYSKANYYSNSGLLYKNDKIFCDKKDAPYPQLLSAFSEDNKYCPYYYYGKPLTYDEPIEIWYSSADDCCYYKLPGGLGNIEVSGKGLLIGLQGAGGAGGAASWRKDVLDRYVKGGAGGGGGAFGIFYINLSMRPDSHYKIYTGKGGKGHDKASGKNGDPSSIEDVAGEVVAFCSGGSGGEFQAAEISTSGGTIAKGGLGGDKPESNSCLESSLLFSCAGGNGGDGGENKYSFMGIGSAEIAQGAEGISVDLHNVSLPIYNKIFDYSNWKKEYTRNNKTYTKQLGKSIGRNEMEGRALGGQSCSGGGGGGGAFMCLSDWHDKTYYADGTLKTSAEGFGAGGAGGSAGYSHEDKGLDGQDGCAIILRPNFY